MSPTGSPQATRIKRKPPPSVDPADPYPSVRNRPSTASLAVASPSNRDIQSHKRKSCYDLYPSILPHTVTPQKDFPVPVDSSSKRRRSHYRLRARSLPPAKIESSLVFPITQASMLYPESEHDTATPVPSLLTDNNSCDSGSATDVETIPTPASTNVAFTPISPSTLAGLLKAHSNSASPEKPTPRRISRLSISPPLAVKHLASGAALRCQPSRSMADFKAQELDPLPLRRVATSDAPPLSENKDRKSVV